MRISVEGGTNAGWRITGSQSKDNWKCPSCKSSLRYYWVRCPNCKHPRD